jgi:hypothetical protein
MLKLGLRPRYSQKRIHKWDFRCSANNKEMERDGAENERNRTRNEDRDRTEQGQARISYRQDELRED